MSRIYWDTMLFVYWLEEHPCYAPRIDYVLERMALRHDTLCTSAFAISELLVGPYKKGAWSPAEKIRDTLRPPAVEVLSRVRRRSTTR